MGRNRTNRSKAKAQKPQSFWSGTNRSTIIRYGLVFPALLLIGFDLLSEGFTSHAIEAFDSAVASAAAGLIRVFHGHVIVQGNLLASPQAGAQLKIINGCDGLHVSILLWAAILVYPSTWYGKLQGLGWGSMAIHILNVLRVVSLYYLLQYNRVLFDFAHLYVWEALITVDALVAFALWAHLTSKVRTAHEA
ncbi:MAG TPA: exosortase H [Bryobacteraceae bacterium]|nr:exosortase H [Bryobacteraceae bacterium]